MIRSREQTFNLLLIPAEHVLFAAGEVGVDLAREQRVFGDVRSAGVVVEGEEGEPDDAGDDADE